jgi:transglutaminase-like putative cysteine protease
MDSTLRNLFILLAFFHLFLLYTVGCSELLLFLLALNTFLHFYFQFFEERSLAIILVPTFSLIHLGLFLYSLSQEQNPSAYQTLLYTMLFCEFTILFSIRIVHTFLGQTCFLSSSFILAIFVSFIEKSIPLLFLLYSLYSILIFCIFYTLYRNRSTRARIPPQEELNQQLKYASSLLGSGIPFFIYFAGGNFYLLGLLTLTVFFSFRYRNSNPNSLASVFLPIFQGIFFFLFLYYFYFIESKNSPSFLNTILFLNFISFFSIRFLNRHLGQLCFFFSLWSALLLLCFSSSISLFFMLFLLSYALCSFYALTASSLWNSFSQFFQKLENRSRRFQLIRQEPRSHQTFLQFILLASSFLFVATLFFFLILPRKPSPLNPPKSDPTTTPSDKKNKALPSLAEESHSQKGLAYPETMEVFHHGPSEQTKDRLLVRLQLLNERGYTYQSKHTLYLRGSVYERYHQGKWIPSQRVPQSFFDQEQGKNDYQIQLPAPPLHSASFEIHQIIHLFPHQSKVCPALAVPLSLQPFDRIDYDQGTLFFPETLYHPLEYEVRSHYTPINSFSITHSVDRSHPDLLTLPPECSVFLKELALQETENYSSDIDKIKALLTFLKTNYSYSLNPPHPPEGQSLIDYFLKENKRGHCVYFSSAFTFMLRSLGIPCRPVGGFAGGNWQEFGEYYEFRHKDAHAWVEIPFRGIGFLPFDCTPSAPLNEVSLSSNTSPTETPSPSPRPSLFTLLSETLLDYNYQTQQKLLEKICAPFYFLAYQNTLTLEKFLLWIALFSFIGWVFLHWNPWSRKEILFQIQQTLPAPLTKKWVQKNSQEIIQQCYHDSLRIYAKKGYRRSPSQTPQEFLSSLPLDHQKEFSYTTSCFQRVFYGRQALDLPAVKRCLQELQQLKSPPKKES